MNATNTQHHTPGPWAFDDGGGEHGQHAVNEATTGGGSWKAIATIHTGRMGGGSAPVQPLEAAANAQLIAVAPELLAMLEEYLSVRPAFRIKPVGAVFSEARREQLEFIALEDRARALIAKAKGGAA